MVGDFNSGRLGGRSNNIDKETTSNANDHNGVGKETSNDNVSEGDQVEESTDGVLSDLHVKTREEIKKSEDTDAMQNEIKKIQEHDSQSPIHVDETPTEMKREDAGLQDSEKEDIPTNPKFNSMRHVKDEDFDTEVLDLSEESLPQVEIHRNPLEEASNNGEFEEENAKKITPEMIDLEPLDLKFLTEGLPTEDEETQDKSAEIVQNSLEVAGTDNYDNIKIRYGFDENMQEVEQVTDVPVEIDSSSVEVDHDVHKQHFPDDTHFRDDELHHPNEEEDFPSDEDFQSDDEHDEAHEEHENILSEEDLIDLMYQDRHLSPYRRIYMKHFGTYPDEEELLSLYKQVAGDLFALDRMEDELDTKEARWKIYSEVYLHHFKESHLHLLGHYPNDAEVSHFQKIFHTQLNRYKNMDPEELRYDAEYGHFPGHGDDDSNFDIPEELHQKEDRSAERTETDPTESEDEDTGDIVEEEPDESDEALELDGDELDPTEMEEFDEDDDDAFEEEEVKELKLDEAAEAKTVPAGSDDADGTEVKATKAEERDVQQSDGGKPAEEARIEHSEKDSGEINKQNEDLEPSNPKAQGEEIVEQVKEEIKEQVPIDTTDRDQDGKVPVSTRIDSPSVVEMKGESSEASQVVHDPGIPAIDTIQEGKPVKRGDVESSGAPENVVPVPTSLESQKPVPEDRIKGITVIGDGVTTIVREDVTTVILDGTTMVENDDEPEVLVSTVSNEQIEPSANAIENTASQQPVSVSTPELNLNSKPTTDAPHMSGQVNSVEQAEGTIAHSHIQHDAPQATQTTDFFSLGGENQLIDKEDNLQASGSLRDGEVSQDRDSVKTNPQGIDTESIVTHTGESEVAEVNAEEVIKAAEDGVKGPGALGGGAHVTNESIGEVPTGDSTTGPTDSLGERPDPYSPSGEYVSRSLHSHQPNVDINQPGSDPKVPPQANIEVNEGGGEPQKGSEQAGAVPTEQQNQQTAEQSNDVDVLFQSAGQEVPLQPPIEEVTPPPVEEVTPPVVPETEEVVPQVQENNAVTEPTPIVEESRQAKEPETVPTEQQEVPPTDEPSKNNDILEDLPPLEDLPAVGIDFPPLEDNPSDPYATNEFHGRKIPDEESVQVKEEEGSSEGWLVWYARQVDSVIGLLDPVLIAVVESVSTLSTLICLTLSSITMIREIIKKET